MVDTELLDATFAALADPTRRAILARLAAGEATVTELAEPFDDEPAGHLQAPQGAGTRWSRQPGAGRPAPSVPIGGPTAA